MAYRITLSQVALSKYSLGMSYVYAMCRVGTFSGKTGFRQGSGNNPVFTGNYREKWYLPGNMWE